MKAKTKVDNNELTLEEDIEMDFVCDVIIDKILSEPKEKMYEWAKKYKKEQLKLKMQANRRLNSHQK